jgi:hypothetical protein
MQSTRLEFDALLGDIRKVAKDRLPQRFKQEDNISTFHPRPFSRERAKEKFEETKQRRDAISSTLIQEYSFTLGFMNGVDPPHVVIKAGEEDGLATRTDENCIVLLLNTGLIGPLLLYRRVLTDFERMGHHWMAAITLVHEVMVGAPNDSTHSACLLKRRCQTNIEKACYTTGESR